MLTSFFGKSKPVHFLILGAFITLGFLWNFFVGSGDSFHIEEFLFKLLLLVVTIFSVILLDFIVGKNHLTRGNAYSIFFYSCFIVMLPIVFLHSDIIWANFFLLLALRRIISLRNDNNSEKKILDGAIWITVASLFYFWSLLFLVPLWIAVIQKPNPTYKQMLIPIVGFFAVLILNTAFQFLIYHSFSWFFEWKQSISLDFLSYNSARIFIPATLILALLIWTGFYRLQHVASISLKERPYFNMLFIIGATSIATAVFGPIKNGSEMIFLFAPTAIFCSNYIEGFKSTTYKEGDKMELWFKEVILWLVLIFAFVFLFI